MVRRRVVKVEAARATEGIIKEVVPRESFSTESEEVAINKGDYDLKLSISKMT